MNVKGMPMTMMIHVTLWSAQYPCDSHAHGTIKSSSDAAKKKKTGGYNGSENKSVNVKN